MSIGVDRGSVRPDFDRSINEVSHGGAPAASLPRRAKLTPVDDGGVGSRTEVLLKPLSPHEKLLRRSLQPPVNDAAAVTPGQYHKLLKHAVQGLRERTAASPSPAVNRAIVVLEDVRERMDHLNVQLKRMLEA